MSRAILRSPRDMISSIRAAFGASASPSQGLQAETNGAERVSKLVSCDRDEALPVPQRGGHAHVLARVTDRQGESVAQLLGQSEIGRAVGRAVVLREAENSEPVVPHSDRHAETRAIAVQVDLAARGGREVARGLHPGVGRGPHLQNPSWMSARDTIDGAHVTQNTERGATDCLEHRVDLQGNEMPAHVGEKRGMCRYGFRRRNPLIRSHCSSGPSVPHSATCQIAPSIASLEARSRAPSLLFGAMSYRARLVSRLFLQNGQRTFGRCTISIVRTASPKFHRGGRGGTEDNVKQSGELTKRLSGLLHPTAPADGRSAGDLS
jgi:hypothetical protein